MTIRELIEALKGVNDDDMEVMFVHPSHDYWRTQLAGGIDYVETGTVEWSEYHREYQIPKDDEKDEEEMERPKHVLLLFP